MPSVAPECSPVKYLHPGTFKVVFPGVWLLFCLLMHPFAPIDPAFPQVGFRGNQRPARRRRYAHLLCSSPSRQAGEGGLV